MEDHITRGGIAVRIEDATFVIRRGRLRIPIATLREVPLMMDGAARFQQGNIMAAIGTAYVQGVRYDTIRAGLLSFFPSPTMTPGRLNLLRIPERARADRLCAQRGCTDGFDGHGAAPSANRRVGVVTAPGDRRDDDIRGLGRLAASLDRVILKEDEDRRGRREGEIAELIIEGLRAGGMRDEQWETAPSEEEAVNQVLSDMGDGDLVVILADDVPGVLAQVQAQAPAANAAL